MRKLAKLTFLVLLPALVLAACGGGPGPGGGVPDLAKIGFSADTNALAIVPTASLDKSQLRRAGMREEEGGDIQPPKNTIVQITADGMMYEVTYYDEENNPVTTSQSFAPEALYDINETYLMAVFTTLFTEGGVPYPRRPRT